MDQRHFRFRPNIISSILLVHLGVAAIVFGSQNLYSKHQYLHSPLDQVSSAKYSPSPNEITTPSGQQRRKENSFIPMLQYMHGDNPSYAPRLEESLKAPDPDQHAESVDISSLEQINETTLVPDLPQLINELHKLIPERLVIEAISVDAPVVPVSYRIIDFQDRQYKQWAAPSTDAVGWHSDSAYLGQQGNTIINGHSSGYNEIFRYLEDLKSGDIIHVYAGPTRFDYMVANIIILKERWEPVEARLDNAKWINPSDDARLTLVSCFPYKSSTHRIIVVAKPTSVVDITNLAKPSPK